MTWLQVKSCGPAVTVQDQGRPGLLGQGISVGGAADPVALAEGAALLGQSPNCAAIEMAGMGGEFIASEDCRIALTGAPMQARLGGTELRWNASHLLPKGGELKLGAVRQGTYGYLHLGGGLATAPLLNSRSTHLAAGLGGALSPGVQLPLGPDRRTETGLCIPEHRRDEGGAIRILPSLQTHRFDRDTLDRFEATTFHRDARGNRMGVRMLHQGAPFAIANQLNILSEVIVPGDIQMTGDGTPYVLLCECQTTGGYPRIGTVIPADLPRVAQAGPGANLRFQFVSREQALEAERRHRAMLTDLPNQIRPLIRDPKDIADLLSYRLIDGMISALDPPD